MSECSPVFTLGTGPELLITQPEEALRGTTTKCTMKKLICLIEGFYGMREYTNGSGVIDDTAG